MTRSATSASAVTRNATDVRPVELSDLDAIVRIDEKLSGQTRKEFWLERLEIAILRPPWMSLVAETDGRCSATGRGTSRHSIVARAAAGARWPGSAGSPAAPTTC
jgi:hypothetical protein